MVVDTSALIAILFNEPDAGAFAAAIAAAPKRLISAVSALEAAIVFKGNDFGKTDITVAPSTIAH